MIEKCSSCGAETPLSNTDVTHAYLDASPGCWARYGEVLAREYSDPKYFSVHALTVDAYALQHPGQASPKTTNSLNLHLASLYAYYRKQGDMLSGDCNGERFEIRGWVDTLDVIRYDDQKTWGIETCKLFSHK